MVWTGLWKASSFTFPRGASIFTLLAQRRSLSQSFRPGHEICREALGFFPVEGVARAGVSQPLRAGDRRPEDRLLGGGTECILIPRNDERGRLDATEFARRVFRHEP